MLGAIPIPGHAFPNQLVAQRLAIPHQDANFAAVAIHVAVPDLLLLPDKDASEKLAEVRRRQFILENRLR